MNSNSMLKIVRSIWRWKMPVSGAVHIDQRLLLLHDFPNRNTTFLGENHIWSINHTKACMLSKHNHSRAIGIPITDAQNQLNKCISKTRDKNNCTVKGWLSVIGELNDKLCGHRHTEINNFIYDHQKYLKNHRINWSFGICCLLTKGKSEHFIPSGGATFEVEVRCRVTW